MKYNDSCVTAFIHYSNGVIISISLYTIWVINGNAIIWNLTRLYRYREDVQVMKKKRILIVEDDRTAASIMQLYLNAMGYNAADIATDGSQAISKVQANPPDLILMDIYLGDGLDGIQAADLINEQFTIPIVYITSYNDNEILVRAQKTNPAGFINKPVREADLRTTIKIALDCQIVQSHVGGNKGIRLQEILSASYGLSPAEIRVVEQLLEDSDLEVICKKLDISVNTVRTHLKRIYRKTGAKSKSALLLKVIKGPAKIALERNKRV